MNCQHCNSPIEANAKFCAGCGAQVAAPAAPAQAEFAPVYNYNHQQPQPYPPQYAVPPKTNNMVIAGFVLAFIIPTLGLILSCVGLSQTKSRNEGGRGLAIAGIAISIVRLVLSWVMFFAFMGWSMNLAYDLMNDPFFADDHWFGGITYLMM
ncbi:MAG: DUF4190 domain-containing protein [Oscillospiraceae bacterium]|nr:DUF4190 domain-containing protein [Oscillospiraceae bacterium]